MQTDPLLVKLDWVFTSSSWTLTFPATFVQTLSRPISDHTPYVMHIGSSIPKSKLFKFENFWVDHAGFLNTVDLPWNSSPYHANAARTLSEKYKQVRAGLKYWSKKLSNLSKLIYNNNWVLLLFDGLEDRRALSRLERAFRTLVKSHLASLLEAKRAYWKQRNTVRWVKFGDENTHFFHTMATISHKRNFIVSLVNADGIIFTEHEQKANLLWAAFKNRLGISESPTMAYNLSDLLTAHDLNGLDDDFSQDEIDTVIKKNLPNSHAPGLDGFNGLFIKKCWSIVKDDFIGYSETFVITI